MTTWKDLLVTSWHELFIASLQKSTTPLKSTQWWTSICSIWRGMVSSHHLSVILTWTSQVCPSWCLWPLGYAGEGIQRSPIVVRSAATRLPSMILLANALSQKYLIQFFQTSGDCCFGPLWALLQVSAFLLRCWWSFHSDSWISDQQGLLTRPGHHRPWEHHPMGDILPRHWKGGLVQYL